MKLKPAFQLFLVVLALSAGYVIRYEIHADNRLPCGRFSPANDPSCASNYTPAPGPSGLTNVDYLPGTALTPEDRCKLSFTGGGCPLDSQYPQNNSFSNRSETSNQATAPSVPVSSETPAGQNTSNRTSTQATPLPQAQQSTQPSAPQQSSGLRTQPVAQAAQQSWLSRITQAIYDFFVCTLFRQCE